MKRIPTLAMIAIVLWGTVMLAPAIRAQGTTAGLDDAGLKDMLTNLGYEPKPLSKGFLVTVKRDTWTFYIQFVISPDKNKIGLNANLGSITKPETVTADQWKNLLIQNGEIDPSTFYYSDTQKKLYLHRTYDNRAVTAAYTREQLDNFVSNMIKTSDYWKFAN